MLPHNPYAKSVHTFLGKNLGGDQLGIYDTHMYRGSLGRPSVTVHIGSVAFHIDRKAGYGQGSREKGTIASPPVQNGTIAKSR